MRSVKKPLKSDGDEFDDDAVTFKYLPTWQACVHRQLKTNEKPTQGYPRK